MKAFVHNHPVIAYAALTFALSWGGCLIAGGGPAGFPAAAAEVSTRLPLFVLVLTSGPVLAGIILTAIADGRAGLRELGRRFVRWKVASRWWLLALGIAPAAALVTLGLLMAVSPAYLPGIFGTAAPATLIAGAIAAGAAGGLLEEPGWTGFLLPRLLKRRSVLSAGLVIGLIWGAWHLIAAYWGSGTPDGSFDLTLFLPQLAFYALALPGFRVLMALAAGRTGSLLIAMVMHATLTGGVLFLFMPAAVSPEQRGIWYLAMAAAFWLAAGILLAADRRRQPAASAPTTAP